MIRTIYYPLILSCWDWGMGWGWTGLNAAFCGTCAMEQAALTNHLPGLQLSHQSTTSLPAMDSSAQQEVNQQYTQYGL